MTTKIKERSAKTLLITGWKSQQVRIGFILTVIALLAALAGPWFAPFSPTDLVGMTYGQPDAQAPLGYDVLGRDVLSRVLAGGQSVVWMSIAASAIALFIGAALGVTGAFLRKKTDQAIVWGTDVLIAFPDLILVLLIVSLLGREHWLIVLTVAIAFIPGVVRLSRGIAFNVVSQEFIEAAEMMGYSRWRILFREIIPNILTPLLVHLGVMLTWAVGMLSGLAFLGYGVAPPTADWGLMINENRAGLLIQPIAVFAPVLLIAIFALGTNLLAEGIGRITSRIEER
ncbi:ABC transporter permease [Cellvibrio polysaccharolyticus]|uniref:ABC transporter permease n=1 Tax=Cellvibrio polysaccharolyticus TaxID=2082724 RepID=A0A928YTP9_9GAMM|nr:ABC transporter permease [Cellvibrio polysaccharolyticus]MBE8716610.1 ABC transporter permease [Cellvibrio polysaccharolyticus]